MSEESRPSPRPPPGSRHGGQPSPAPRRWLAWAAAAAAVIAGSAFTGAFVATRYEARLGQMARETARIRTQITASEALLREQLGRYRDAVELLRDPATRVLELAGAGPRGRMIWHERRGGYLVAADLPPPPPGTTYALWTVSGTVSRPAGALAVDANGRVSHPVEAAPEGETVTAFTVTLEPDGSAAATPEGPVVLAWASRRP